MRTYCIGSGFMPVTDAVTRPILTVHCANMLPGKQQIASEYCESQFFKSYQFLWNWLSVVTYLVEISDFLTFISNPICFKFTHVENLIYFCENRMIFPVNFFAILANLICHLIHAEMPYCVSNSSIRKPSTKDFPVATSHFATKTARQTVRMMTYLIGRGQEV